MREALNKVLLGRPLRIAAVTDSIVGRGVVTAISWFNPQIRACSPSKPKDVFTHLGLSAEESKRAIEALTAISRLMPGVVSLSTLLSSFASASATPRA
jgi:hypothetical protein